MAHIYLRYNHTHHVYGTILLHAGRFNTIHVHISAVCTLYWFDICVYFYCFQFQGVQDHITDIMQKMYSKIGTPENCKEMEKEWNDRLTEIDDKLKAFQEAAASHRHHHNPSSDQVNI